MAIVGQSLTAPEAGWQRFNDTDPNIKYEGAWVLNELYPETWKKSMTYSTTEGSKIKFNFTGTKIRIIGYNTSNRSTSVDVYIDGLLVRNFSAYTTAGAPQALNADIAGLSNSEHSVVIVNNATGGYGNIFSLDAVDIDATGSLKPYLPVSEVPAPNNLTATAGDAKVALDWNAVTGATGYNVKRSKTAGGLYETIAPIVPGTSYVDFGLTNGTTYYYVVTAITANSESGNSNEASATPKAEVIPPIGNALLRVVMSDSSEREYKVSQTEIDGFVNWFTRTIGTGISCYALNDIVDGSKEYLAYEKIISFKVVPVVNK